MTIEPGRVASAPLIPFVGAGWRHLSPRYDPLSGEGAQIAGGRFNAANSFPVLYICLSRPCAVAELQRLGDRQAIGVEGLLPRYLYRYDIDLQRVLDLTDPETRHTVGLSRDALVAPDRSACQELGSMAHALAAQAIRSPSAASVDDVLAVFVQHLGLGTLEPRLVEEWHSARDVNAAE